ncbi:hypothetical protein [Neobacillus cucumis]|uniref:hypothetical protein n=1 Tax=Neobacillus cucumis TaxID=1740721 RepID=UPI0035579951
MSNEEVITKGLIERIGLNDSVFNITFGSQKIKEILDIPNHKAAVKLLLDKLTALQIIDTLNEHWLLCCTDVWSRCDYFYSWHR